MFQTSEIIDLSVLDISAARYAEAGRHVVAMLNSRLQQQLPTPTADALEDFAVTACYADALIDTPTEHGFTGNRSARKSILNYLLAEPGQDKKPLDFASSNPAPARLQNFLSQHDGGGRAAFARDFNRVWLVGDKLQTIRDPELFTAATRIEGRIAMRAGLALLPDHIRHNPANSKMFSWLQRLGQLGNSYDSFADAATDIDESRVIVDSLFRLRIALAKGILSDTTAVVGGMRFSEMSGRLQNAIGVLKGTEK